MLLQVARQLHRIDPVAPHFVALLALVIEAKSRPFLFEFRVFEGDVLARFHDLVLQGERTRSLGPAIQGDGDQDGLPGFGLARFMGHLGFSLLR